jgi:hypothetical protein
MILKLENPEQVVLELSSDILPWPFLFNHIKPYFGLKVIVSRDKLIQRFV